MPSPKAQRNGAVLRGKMTEKSMSFHGKGGVKPEEKLRRPKTVPDLRSPAMNGSLPAVTEIGRPKLLTKVLFNVAVQGSVGNVQVLMSPESTVRDLISDALKQYLKERRRPVISCSDAGEFNLHYSQFSLESLEREEKLAALGSRNFFMCRRRKEVADGGSNDGASTSSPTSSSSCSKQAEKVTELGSPLPSWLKFMTFLSST